MTYRHGSKIVAKYYIDQFDLIEKEMNKKTLAAEQALALAKSEEELLAKGQTHCTRCKMLINIDFEVYGWSTKEGFYHQGTCPTNIEGEREIRV